MQEGINSFLNAMRVERNLSENTIASYRFDLEAFVKCVQSADIQHIQARDIEDYLMRMYMDHKKVTTVNRALSALRRFFSFACMEGWINKNPILHIENPKSFRKLPTTLNLEEIIKILDVTQELFENDGIREKAMIMLLYGSGLRVSEMISLKWKHIEMPFLRVLGKGSKERLVPLSTQTYHALQQWYPYASTSAWIFPSPDPQHHVTRQRVFQIIKTVTQAIGLDGISPHVLRHAFATHILENGANLLSIKKMLGHKNLSTTEIYMHVNKRGLRDAIHKYHPLAQQTQNTKE